MKTSISIIATNAVITASDGRREMMSDRALEDGARQINEQGGLPQLLEHDWLRPTGWVQRAWVEREGDVVRLVGESVLPETHEDWRAILARFRAYMNSWAAKHNELYAELASSQGAELTFDSDCVYLQAPGLARRLCPTVFSTVDEDGLIPLSAVPDFDDDTLESNGHLLVPCPSLRAGCSLPNSPNRSFIRAFFAAAKSSDPQLFRLSLDEDLIGISASLKPMEQRDFWWGPPYRGRPSQQPYGVTVHGPTQYDQLNGLIRTEFWWYGRTERTFEMEELVDRQDIRTTANSPRGMRFVHSIFQGNTDHARHLDGAIRVYTPAQWMARLEPHVNISNFGKQAERRKVWRVDGDIRPELWYELIYNFFRGNFTVAEYFGLPDPIQARTLANSPTR